MFLFIPSINFYYHLLTNNIKVLLKQTILIYYY